MHILDKYIDQSLLEKYLNAVAILSYLKTYSPKNHEGIRSWTEKKTVLLERIIVSAKITEHDEGFLNRLRIFEECAIESITEKTIYEYL